MPFLAPAAPFIGAGLSALGILGQGRAAGRQAEDAANQQRDRTALEGALLNLRAPGIRGSTAVQGDIMAGAQDVQVGGPITRTGGRIPTITGGLRPSLMSGNTRQLGSQMSRDALLSQMQGPAFTPSEMPKAGKFDKFLNVMSGIGSGLGIAGEMGAFKPRQRPTTPQQPFPSGAWDDVRF